MLAGAYNRDRGVRCVTRYLGKITSDSIKTAQNRRTTTASKRTKRPTPMGVTAGIWTTTLDNGASYSETAGAWTREGLARHVWPSGPITKNVSDSSSDIPNALNLATRAFVSNTGAGITLLELPSSVRMIGRRAATFYQAVRLMGKGQFAKLKPLMLSATGYNISNRQVDHLSRKYGEGGFTFARASAAWLELSFGWKTFFGSIYDSLVHALTSTSHYQRNRTVNGAKAGFFATVTNTRDFNLNRLGITNLAEMAWDKLRLSFVIDWFIPITPVLRSLSAGRGLGTIHGFTCSEKVTTTFSKGVWTSTTKVFVRSKVVFGISNLSMSSSGGLWQAITSLALFQGMR